MDRAMERVILSRNLNCLKKIKLQAKPGRKKTSATPRIALTIGTLSRNGRINPNSSLTGASQSIQLIPLA
jgi:hypothetical protein